MYVTDNESMKTPAKQKLIRRQVGRKLEELVVLKEASPGVSSWIKYLREALGMSLAQLAARLKLSLPTVAQAERLEKEGKITIHKLREIANAMDCDFVYAFVPRKKLDELVFDQAKKKVERAMKHTELHMSLENQKVKISKESQEERLKDLIDEKIYSKYLWDNDDLP